MASGKVAGWKPDALSSSVGLILLQWNDTGQHLILLVFTLYKILLSEKMISRAQSLFKTPYIYIYSINL